MRRLRRRARTVLAYLLIAVLAVVGLAGPSSGVIPAQPQGTGAPVVYWDSGAHHPSACCSIQSPTFDPLSSTMEIRLQGTCPVGTVSAEVYVSIDKYPNPNTIGGTITVWSHAVYQIKATGSSNGTEFDLGITSRWGYYLQGYVVASNSSCTGRAIIYDAADE